MVDFTLNTELRRKKLNHTVQSFFLILLIQNKIAWELQNSSKHVQKFWIEKHWTKH